MERARQRLVEALEEEAATGSRTVAAVPASYAERAMNSLMTLHHDVVAEKERVLDLTRRLMEERQGRAELESYVRLLESEVARLGGPDLREVRGADGAGARRAVEHVLTQRASRPAPAEATSAPGETTEAPGEASAPSAERHPLPRPPRPSRRYRTKVRLSAQEAVPAAEADAEAAPPAEAAPASTAKRRADDWRQW